MDEPGWITFYTAAHLLREKGMGWAEACKLLRAGCRDELLTSMAAPDDEPGSVLPFEYWKRIAPSEWRQRDVDYDGPDADGCKLVVMLKDDDFRRWLLANPQASSQASRVVEPSVSELKPKDRAKPKTELVKLAWAKLELPPNIPAPEAEKLINDWFKANGHTTRVSKSTIVRFKKTN
jgi:hypothetical protein